MLPLSEAHPRQDPPKKAFCYLIQINSVMCSSLANEYLLLFAKVLNKFVEIICMAASKVFSLITTSGASCSSRRSMISIKHSFLFSFSSVSFFESPKSAMVWHARSLAKYRICQRLGSTSIAHVYVRLYLYIGKRYSWLTYPWNSTVVWSLSSHFCRQRTDFWRHFGFWMSFSSVSAQQRWKRLFTQLGWVGLMHSHWHLA